MPSLRYGKTRGEECDDREKKVEKVGRVVEGSKRSLFEGNLGAVLLLVDTCRDDDFESSLLLDLLSLLVHSSVEHFQDRTGSFIG